MPETCALMAARLKQIARDEKRITANAARRSLRQVVTQATKDYAKGGTLGRKLWGGAFWTGRKHTQSSLGLSSKTKWYARTGKRWDAYHKDWQRGRTAAARVRSKGGSGIPLIVSMTKSRWVGDVWRGGVQSRGVAAYIEEGRPFKAHRQGRGRHPGGAVHQHRSLEPALQRRQGDMSREVQRDVQQFLAEALR